MSDTQSASTATVALTSLWLAPASKERISTGFAADITEGLESASSATVVVVSTRLPRLRMSAVMQQLRESVKCPIVVLCHAGGELTARDLLKFGATHMVAEGNEAIIAGLIDAGPGTEILGEDGVPLTMPTPDPEPLLTGFTFDLEHDNSPRINGGDDGVDPVTHLPSDVSFNRRFGELTQRETLPRVGFIRVANAAASLAKLDQPTLDLVRRRLVLQFRNLIAERSVELFMTDGLELALLSTILTSSQMSRLADELIRAAESFAPSGREPIRLAIGHAGPEVANDSRTLRELAESAAAAAVAQGGGVVSGDELALSRANATEHEAATALADSVDKGDSHTGAHSARVAELAAAIGRELGVEGIDLIRLRLAARFHDIGKIHMPPELLAEDPNSLTDDDNAIYRAHPEVGAGFLALSVHEDVGSAVRHHHEAWDGSGFPDSITETDIPFAARVIAVSNHLDSAVDKGATSPSSAITAIQECSGTLHDPAVVGAAVTLLSAGDLDSILF